MNHTHLWWYVARASGLVAWALLTLSMLWGVALAARLLGRAARPSWLLDLHRGLGGLATIFTGIHVAGAIADTNVHFGLADVLVPMASKWQPGAMAWGVVGLYLVVAIEGTSLLLRHLPKRLWRRVHELSFVLWVATTVHLLRAGTDASNRLVLLAALVSTAAVVATGAVTLLREKPERSIPRAAA
jgi:DMSO/TMAO reductase YedYZ heme-binding membrane subunit